METRKEPIEITVVDLLDEIKEKIKGEVTITEKNSKMQFGYNENLNDSIFDYSVTIDMKNDSVLIYDHGNEICTLDDVRNYSINGGQISIKRYSYDVAGTFDEEADFFFIDCYGLVAMNFYDGHELFFDRGNSFSKTIIEQLRKEEGFYKRKSEPGELPPDYDSVEIEAELDTIKFDIAMLECGQYDLQWPNIHMMPEETVQAGVDLKAEVLMPVHWGKFVLANHPWKEPIQRAKKHAETLNIKVATPIIGEPIILGGQIPGSEWWNGIE